MLQKYLIQPYWKSVLKGMGVDGYSLFSEAGINPKLLDSSNAAITPSDFYITWRECERSFIHQPWIQCFTDSLSLKTFKSNPDLKAHLFCANLNMALKGWSDYLTLTSPAYFDLRIGTSRTEITWEHYCYPLLPTPLNLILSEMVYMIKVAALGTGHSVRPLMVKLPIEPQKIRPLHDYFCCTIQYAQKPAIIFTAQDARQPFVTHNPNNLEIYMKQLNMRVFSSKPQSKIVQQVQSILRKWLPSRKTDIEHVSTQMGVKPSQLINELNNHNVTYDCILDSLRLDMAEHYLSQKHYTLLDIYQLLGFASLREFNEFYEYWAGRTIEDQQQRIARSIYQ